MCQSEVLLFLKEHPTELFTRNDLCKKTNMTCSIFSMSMKLRRLSKSGFIFYYTIGRKDFYSYTLNNEFKDKVNHNKKIHKKENSNFTALVVEVK